MKLINGIELDVYVNHESKKDAFIHICFYFEDSANRKNLHDIIEKLYSKEGSRPTFKNILNELSQLNCKIITIPHGNKDRGLLDHYLIDHFVSEDRKEFYKYAMYKIFNAFDITPASINNSEEHWAFNFYEKTQSFSDLLSKKTDEEIHDIKKHIIEYIKDEKYTLTQEELDIYTYAKSYGSYYAYFAFSDWHNNKVYNPAVNNFIFGCIDNAFNSFELATLDPLSRIEKTKDKQIEISDSLLKKVEFKINGIKRDVDFSPGLNAIVGKRGSGKSLLVSVIRNLANSTDPDGAIIKYKKLHITDISCENRGGISLTPGRLGSVEFLKQDEIRDIIDDPKKAQQRIKSKFPPIKEMDLSQIIELANLCDLIEPFNKDYKSITSELMATNPKKDYIFKSHDVYETSFIETNFGLSISSLEKVKKDLETNGFSTSSLDKLIDELKSTEKEYITKISFINDVIIDNNKRIAEHNKVLSLNQDNSRKNISNINAAFQLIDGNFEKALAFKTLKYQLANFSINIHPAAISREGRYLFATYYDAQNNIKEELSRAITNTLTYSSDELNYEVTRFLNGDEKRKLKSNYTKLGDGLRELVSGDYFKSKQSFYEIVNDSVDYKNTIKTYDILKEYVDNGYLVDLNSASMGMKSVAYLNMLFELENKILVFDQPEDNIDNDYISNHLVPIIKSNKKIKQLIFVTHNPSVAVYGDAFNYIYTENENEITYKNFFIENVNDKEKLLKILEGGRSSFSSRNKKYGDIIGDEQYGN